MKNIILKNGIRLVCCQMDNVHSVVFGVCFKGGAEWETEENCGIAHLTEHMFFRRANTLRQEELYRLTEPDFAKVIKYNETEARVYYVKKYEVGSTIDFIKENNEWKLKSWGDKAWSSDGSAESAVFPYFWHPVTMR